MHTFDTSELLTFPQLCLSSHFPLLRFLLLVVWRKKVKRTYYKDDSDETRATRRSSRRSMFRSGQDAGVATSTRSPAKIATKGFTKGSTVRTSLGPATVSKVRSEDGMCEVREVFDSVGRRSPCLLDRETFSLLQANLSRETEFSGANGFGENSLFS